MRPALLLHKALPTFWNEILNLQFATGWRRWKEPELIRILLNYEERTGHLPQLLHDVIARLRLDTQAPISAAAGHPTVI